MIARLLIAAMLATTIALFVNHYLSNAAHLFSQVPATTKEQSQ